MQEKKHILLLTTGGTIASVPGGEGLEPQRADVLERELHPAGGMAVHRHGNLQPAPGL